MMSRRDLVVAPAAAFLASRIAGRAAGAAPGKMSLALHQNTSSRAGFRPSLEGWAKAGITQVELTGNVLDQFVRTDSVAAAKRVLSDLNLKPVSGSGGILGLIKRRARNGRREFQEAMRNVGRTRYPPHLLDHANDNQAVTRRLQSGG